MLIHKCTKCSKIFRFSSMPGPSDARCTGCGEQVVWVGQTKDPAEDQLIERDQIKTGLNWPFLLDTLKTLGIAWGVGGVVNLATHIPQKNIANFGSTPH